MNVARFATFLESDYITKKASGSNSPLEVMSETTNELEPEQQEVVQDMQVLCRSGRVRQEPERYGFLVTQQGDVLLVENDEQSNYKEEIASSDKQKWLEAMQSKMESISNCMASRHFFLSEEAIASS